MRPNSQNEWDGYRSLGRPLLCTEYMARSLGSTFEEILPVAKANNVAAFNWGLVSGKTQTNLPWTSWQSHSTDDPEARWFHEILHENGSAYSELEVETIRSLIKGDPTCGIEITIREPRSKLAAAANDIRDVISR